MILLSTIIKVASMTATLLLAGGFTYYYLNNNEPTQHLRVVQHRPNNHFLDQMAENKEQHLCDHGNYIKTIQIQEPERPSQIPIESTLAHEYNLLKKDKQGNWQTIRIKTDYSSFKADQSQANFIENRLMKATIGFLKAAVKVYPSQQLFLSGQCSSVPIPQKYQKGYSDADLVLFITATESEESWMARAGACSLDPVTNRPTAGSVEFNLQFLKEIDLNNLSDGKWYGWIQTTIHEVLHVMGFSSSLFEYYVNPETNQKLGLSQIVKRKGGRDWIILPQVVNAVKNHFGCQEAFGAPLEDDGGSGTAGSHWERTTFGNEAMTGSDFPDSVFTTFTFNLLESTGWYQMDHRQSEPFNWGKDEGCSIVQGQCAEGLREFCNVGGRGCTSDFTGIASCSQSDELAGGCKYWKAFSNTDCRYKTDYTNNLAKNGGYIGNDSKCFQTTLPNEVGFKGLFADCFQASCSNDVVTFSIAGKSYQCKSTGQIINVKYSYYSATVTCPDVKHFCKTQRACPNACSGVGTCRGTTCYCWAGYSGADCSVSS